MRKEIKEKKGNSKEEKRTGVGTQTLTLIGQTKKRKQDPFGSENREGSRHFEPNPNPRNDRGEGAYLEDLESKPRQNRIGSKEP